MEIMALASKLGDTSAAQHGFFTRTQARHLGINDNTLSVATRRGAVDRVGRGIYRIAGTGSMPFEDLWVAWLRLVDVVNPRDRVLRPETWVSHQSAALVHGFGDFIADSHHFTTKQRRGSRPGVKLHRRADALQRNEWTNKYGFAVTSVERTAADLLNAHIDGGHVGRFLQEALYVNETTITEIMGATQLTRNQVEALISQ